MAKLIIDSQNLPVQIGRALAQGLEQRGAFCYGHAGDLAIVTEPVPTEFLDYWSQLGFSTPDLLVLDDDINKGDLLQRLFANPSALKIVETWLDRQSQVEYCCYRPDFGEQDFCRHFGIQLDANIELTNKLLDKRYFKQLAEAHHLSVLPTLEVENLTQGWQQLQRLKNAGERWLCKAAKGVGGEYWGSISCINEYASLDEFSKQLGFYRNEFFLEPHIDVKAELSVQWFHAHSTTSVIGIFEQIAHRNSYTGAQTASFELEPIIAQVKNELQQKMIPMLEAHDYRGNACCDVLIDANNRFYWSDFNPRKGGITYVAELMRRIAERDGYCGDYVMSGNDVFLQQTLSQGEISYQTSLDKNSPQQLSVLYSPGTIRLGKYSELQLFN